MVSSQRLILKSTICILLLLGFFTAECQPPIIQNPAELLPTNLDPKTLTQSQLQSLLSDKNKENAGKDKNAQLAKEVQKLEKDSVVKDNVKSGQTKLAMTYGADIFSNAAVTDLSELSTPPLDYPIGVGDHIVVSLWGAAEFQEDYVVGRDGTIFPQGLGKIQVQGLTFDNVRSVIYSRFRSAVPTGTNIAVSLGQPRTININVVGEVNNPGPITVSAFSNVFNVVAKAGGVTKFGNLRSIQLKRNGKVIDEVDVYKYLTSGDFGKHIYLQNNDFVIVGFVEKKVFATGQFKRPMYYQLKKDEGVRALLKYSGGLSSDAYASGMKIIRTENEKQVQKDVNANAILKIPTQDFLLNDGDIVSVDAIKPGIYNKVQLSGEVTYPAIYELRPNDRLYDIINRAGGLTRNTFLQRAYIFRGAGDSTSLKSDRLEIDLSDYNDHDANNPANVLLEPNDLIQVFSQAEFTEPQFVEIFGEVRKEGKMKKYGGMTLQDLLYLSGGLKPSAEFGRLEISSIVDIDSAQQGLKPTRTVVKSYAIQPNLVIDSVAAKVVLKPYDQVFVRKNPTFELQQNIEIRGMVKYPGYYPRLNKHETLSSYIERAGGLQENANVGGAVLYRHKIEMFREKVIEKPKVDSLGNIIHDSLSASLKSLEEPVSIDLYRALKNKGSKNDIVLQEQDMIFVPEINPFITIQGAVQSPLKITYDRENTKLMYYIDKAGGFGVKPWRKRIYVTYANGKSKRTKNFFFFHFYPKVEEGSMITVPKRPQGSELSDLGKSLLVAAVPVILTGIIFKYIK